MSKQFICEVRSGPRSCSGPLRSTACTRFLRCEGLESWKITPDCYLCLKYLFVRWNQVHGVVQGHPDQQHVPVLCGVKGHTVENHTRLVFMPKKFIFEVKSGPWSCSWPPRSTTFKPQRTGTCCWSGWPWTTPCTWFDMINQFFGHKYQSGVIFNSLALQTAENGYMLLIWMALNNSVHLIWHDQ